MSALRRRERVDCRYWVQVNQRYPVCPASHILICLCFSAFVLAREEGVQGPTYTFMPAQKAVEDLWSHVYTMQLRTCFPDEAKTVSQAQQQSIEISFQDFNVRDGGRWSGLLGAVSSESD